MGLIEQIFTPLGVIFVIILVSFTTIIQWKVFTKPPKEYDKEIKLVDYDEYDVLKNTGIG